MKELNLKVSPPPQGNPFWTRYKVAAQSGDSHVVTEVTFFGHMNLEDATGVALDKVAFIAATLNLPWDSLNQIIVLYARP